MRGGGPPRGLNTQSTGGSSVFSHPLAWKIIKVPDLQGSPLDQNQNQGDAELTLPKAPGCFLGIPPPQRPWQWKRGAANTRGGAIQKSPQDLALKPASGTLRAATAGAPCLSREGAPSSWLLSMGSSLALPLEAVGCSAPAQDLNGEGGAFPSCFLGQGGGGLDGEERPSSLVDAHCAKPLGWGNVEVTAQEPRQKRRPTPK